MASNASGLRIQSDNVIVDRITIKGFPGYGIDVFDPNGTFIDNTLIKGTKIDSNKGGGMAFHRASFAAISQNLLTGNINRGIRIGGASTLMILTLNSIQGPVTGSPTTCISIEGQSSHISVGDQELSDIANQNLGNTIAFCDRGVFVKDQSDGISIEGNKFGFDPFNVGLYSPNYIGVELASNGQRGVRVFNNAFACHSSTSPADCSPATLPPHIAGPPAGAVHVTSIASESEIAKNTMYLNDTGISLAPNVQKQHHILFNTMYKK